MNGLFRFSDHNKVRINHNVQIPDHNNLCERLAKTRSVDTRPQPQLSQIWMWRPWLQIDRFDRRLGGETNREIVSFRVVRARGEYV